MFLKFVRANLQDNHNQAHILKISNPSNTVSFCSNPYQDAFFYKVKAAIYEVGFRSGQLDMWIFSFSTLRPQSDK